MINETGYGEVQHLYQEDNNTFVDDATASFKQTTVNQTSSAENGEYVSVDTKLNYIINNMPVIPNLANATTNTNVLHDIKEEEEEEEEEEENPSLICESTGEIPGQEETKPTKKLEEERDKENNESHHNYFGSPNLINKSLDDGNNTNTTIIDNTVIHNDFYGASNNENIIQEIEIQECLVTNSSPSNTAYTTNTNNNNNNNNNNNDIEHSSINNKKYNSEEVLKQPLDISSDNNNGSIISNPQQINIGSANEITKQKPAVDNEIKLNESAQTVSDLNTVANDILLPPLPSSNNDVSQLKTDYIAASVLSSNNNNNTEITSVNNTNSYIKQKKQDDLTECDNTTNNSAATVLSNIPLTATATSTPNDAYFPLYNNIGYPSAIASSSVKSTGSITNSNLPATLKSHMLFPISVTSSPVPITDTTNTSPVINVDCSNNTANTKQNYSRRSSITSSVSKKSNTTSNSTNHCNKGLAGGANVGVNSGLFQLPPMIHPDAANNYVVSNSTFNSGNISNNTSNYYYAGNRSRSNTNATSITTSTVSTPVNEINPSTLDLDLINDNEESTDGQQGNSSDNTNSQDLDLSSALKMSSIFQSTSSNLNVELVNTDHTTPPVYNNPTNTHVAPNFGSNSPSTTSLLSPKITLKRNFSNPLITSSANGPIPTLGSSHSFTNNSTNTTTHINMDSNSKSSTIKNTITGTLSDITKLRSRSNSSRSMCSNGTGEHHSIGRNRTPTTSSSIKHKRISIHFPKNCVDGNSTALSRNRSINAAAATTTSSSSSSNNNNNNGASDNEHAIASKDGVTISQEIFYSPTNSLYDNDEEPDAANPDFSVNDNIKNNDQKQKTKSTSVLRPQLIKRASSALLKKASLGKFKDTTSNEVSPVLTQSPHFSTPTMNTTPNKVNGVEGLTSSLSNMSSTVSNTLSHTPSDDCEEGTSTCSANYGTTFGDNIDSPFKNMVFTSAENDYNIYHYPLPPSNNVENNQHTLKITAPTLLTTRQRSLSKKFKNGFSKIIGGHYNSNSNCKEDDSNIQKQSVARNISPTTPPAFPYCPEKKNEREASGDDSGYGSIPTSLPKSRANSFGNGRIIFSGTMTNKYQPPPSQKDYFTSPRRSLSLKSLSSSTTSLTSTLHRKRSKKKPSIKRSLSSSIVPSGSNNSEYTSSKNSGLLQSVSRSTSFRSAASNVKLQHADGSVSVQISPLQSIINNGGYNDDNLEPVHAVSINTPVITEAVNKSMINSEKNGVENRKNMSNIHTRNQNFGVNGGITSEKTNRGGINNNNDNNNNNNNNVGDTELLLRKDSRNLSGWSKDVNKEGDGGDMEIEVDLNALTKNTPIITITGNNHFKSFKRNCAVCQRNGSCAHHHTHDGYNIVNGKKAQDHRLMHGTSHAGNTGTRKVLATKGKSMAVNEHILSKNGCYVRNGDSIGSNYGGLYHNSDVGNNYESNIYFDKFYQEFNRKNGNVSNASNRNKTNINNTRDILGKKKDGKGLKGVDEDKNSKSCNKITISLKEYIGVLMDLQRTEDEKFDTLERNFKKNGWVSEKELNGLKQKRVIVNKNWADRISFYQNKI